MRKIAICLVGLLTAACGMPHLPVSVAQGAATNEKEEAPVYVTAICGDCHAVTANAISPNPQAPGFEDIANGPGVTRDTLIAFLSDAHNYPLQMDVDLDAADIEEIADHMITLQSAEYHRRPS